MAVAQREDSVGTTDGASLHSANVPASIGIGSRTAWRDAALAWAVAHLLLILALVPAVNLDHSNAFRHLLYNWDANDYAGIALHGYWSPRVTAWYPLLPLTERLLAPLVHGNAAIAGAIVSNICELATFALFRVFVETETGNVLVARRALVYLALSPFAVVFTVGLTESLFLLLSLGFFVALHRRRWLLAAVLTSLALLTRSQGALLVLPAVVVLLQVNRLQVNRWRRPSWRQAAMIVFPLLTVCCFWLYITSIYGSPEVSIQAQRVYWARWLDWPWSGVWTEATIFIGSRNATQVVQAVIDFVSVALGLAVCTTLVLPRVRRAAGVTIPLALYTWTSMLLALSIPVHQSDASLALHCVPRYLLVIFPIYMVLACASTRFAWVHRIVWLLSLIIGVFATTMWALGWYLV